jgi:hypothetical protein
MSSLDFLDEAMSTSRRARPPKQSRPMPSTIVDCGNARLFLTRLADPIGDLTVCLEIHETLSLGQEHNKRYESSVAFVLLTDQEIDHLEESLKFIRAARIQ